MLCKCIFGVMTDFPYIYSTVLQNRGASASAKYRMFLQRILQAPKKCLQHSLCTSGGKIPKRAGLEKTANQSAFNWSALNLENPISIFHGIQPTSLGTAMESTVFVNVGNELCIYPQHTHLRWKLCQWHTTKLTLHCCSGNLGWALLNRIDC